jgi:molybdopterin converting factor small subunit
MAHVRVPPVLRSHTGGAREVEASGATVQETLTNLAESYPSLREQLFDGDEIKRYLNVYVNDQDIQYLEKMQTPVADGDTVILLPAMAGGSQSA